MSRPSNVNWRNLIYPNVNWRNWKKWSNGRGQTLFSLSTPANTTKLFYTSKSSILYPSCLCLVTVFSSSCIVYQDLLKCTFNDFHRKFLYFRRSTNHLVYSENMKKVRQLKNPVLMFLRMKIWWRSQILVWKKKMIKVLHRCNIFSRAEPEIKV